MLAVDYMLTKPAGVRSLVLASPCLSVSRWLSDAETLKKTLPESLQALIEKHELATYVQRTGISGGCDGVAPHAVPSLVATRGRTR